MALRNNVTFSVAMPVDMNLHPIGEEVAAYLAGAIQRESDLSATIDNWRDCGYELDFVINNKAIHFVFAFVPDQPFQFYGQVASYVGWLRRLFGYRDDDEEATLIGALAKTLRNDPMFIAVSWHEAWYDEEKKSSCP